MAWVRGPHLWWRVKPQDPTALPLPHGMQEEFPGGPTFGIQRNNRQMLLGKQIEARKETNKLGEMSGLLNWKFF